MVDQWELIGQYGLIHHKSARGANPLMRAQCVDVREVWLTPIGPVTLDEDEGDRQPDEDDEAVEIHYVWEYEAPGRSS